MKTELDRIETAIEHQHRVDAWLGIDGQLFIQSYDYHNSSDDALLVINKENVQTFISHLVEIQSRSL